MFRFRIPDEEDYFYRCGTTRDDERWSRWFGPPVEVVPDPDFDPEEDRREEMIALSEIVLNSVTR